MSAAPRVAGGRIHRNEQMESCSASRRAPSLILLCAALLGTAAPGHAQQYPSRPVRVIVPFAPGGGSDILARAARAEADRVSGASRFVIDNRGGAGGLVGTEMARRRRRTATRSSCIPAATPPTRPLYKSSSVPVSAFATVDRDRLQPVPGRGASRRCPARSIDRADGALEAGAGQALLRHRRHRQHHASRHRAARRCAAASSGCTCRTRRRRSRWSTWSPARRS